MVLFVVKIKSWVIKVHQNASNRKYFLHVEHVFSALVISKALVLSVFFRLNRYVKNVK